MKISRFELANFRSYEKAAPALTPDMNVLVGENNVGKSNLLVALQILRALGGGLSKEDWPDGKANGPMVLLFECELDDRDVSVISDELEVSVEDFKKSFANTLSVRVDWKHPNRPIESSVRIGSLHIYGDTAGIHPTDPTIGYSSVGWREIVDKSKGTGVPLAEVAREEIQKARSQRGSEVRIAFLGKNHNQTIGRLLQDSLIIFPEFRLRPEKVAAEVLASPEGRQIASVLFNLKTGTKAQRERFGRIQDYFSSLFFSLKLDVMRGPIIVIENVQRGHEAALEMIGAGIAEMIILLTHIVASEDRVFAIDGPELHLHPHSQRLLQKILEESSLKNQLVIVTHSPQFIELQQIDRIILVRETKGRSHLIQLPRKFLSDAEKKKLSRITGSESKEFLFSKRVLLVEGETERGAIPIFAEKLKVDFDKHGVSVVSIGGYHFGTYLKILKGLGFPYVVMCDRDVLMAMQDKIELSGRHVRTSPLFSEIHRAGLLEDNDSQVLSECESQIEGGDLSNAGVQFYADRLYPKLNGMAAKYGFRVLPSDFEGVLRETGCEKLLGEASTEYRHSKVLQGKYVAEKIEEVPEPFEDIVRQVVGPSRIESLEIMR